MRKFDQQRSRASSTLMRPMLAPLLIVALLGACRTQEEVPSRDADAQARAAVEMALQRYQEAARRVDPDSVAAAFTTDGTLFEPGIAPVRGRNAIRAFVSSFPGVKVDSASALPDTVEIHGKTAYIWGSYFERLSFPGQPQSEQHGKFVAEWIREGSDSWLLHRMFRVPIPTPPASAAAPPSGTR